MQELNIVAPFWSDNDIRISGNVSYAVIIKGDSEKGDEMLKVANEYFQQQEGTIDFEGVQMLVAQWDHVHPFPHGSPDEYSASITRSTELDKVQ